MRKTWMISIFVILLIIGLIVGIFYIRRLMKDTHKVRQELAQLKDNAGINQNSESESEVNNNFWKSELDPRFSDERKNNSNQNLEKNRKRRKENAKEDDDPGVNKNTPDNQNENEDSKNNLKDDNEFESDKNKEAELNNNDNHPNISKESEQRNGDLEANAEADPDIKKAMADHVLDELDND